MSSGWNLTARLVAKHFSALGDKISGVIANFDPETATEADRDQLRSILQDSAQKLAKARADFAKEQKDVVDLKALIATDEKALETLGARLAAGTISEATVTIFCDELEANKGRVALEEQEAADAREFMGEFEEIVKQLSQQLADFDAAAKKALQALAAAEAQKDLQAARQARQEQLAGFKGVSNQSNALSALTRRAEQMSNEAAGMKIVTDIAQKPLDQAAEIAAIRKSVTEVGTGETALQRLQRLSGKSVA
ncbi:MAG: hypothetical protein K2Q15_08990 [Burkholderiales bacterium]|jgi:hypothetical protein|nr:hypothetical protein [Burkholderiales bacterium]MCX7204916.1 hypothetical protein [Pseudomonadota bacterium]